MAIQPIDLQALFSQLDKVGKNQVIQREGHQIQEALQQIQTQRKNEENVRSVNEAREMGDEAEKIKDDKERKFSGGRSGSGKKDEEEEDSPPENGKQNLIRDPALGHTIDISG